MGKKVGLRCWNNPPDNIDPVVSSLLIKNTVTLPLVGRVTGSWRIQKIR
jgi:hypothetical protein